jgi:predicted MFS family arabinose efflux permease
VLPLFPASRRVTAIATWTSISTLGSAVGPSVAAVVTQRLSWRWIFVFPLAITVAAYSVAPRVLPEGAPVDGVGQANAAFNAVRALGGGLGIALVVALLGDAPLIPLRNFDHAYLAIAAMTLVGWLVVTLLYPRDADRDVTTARPATGARSPAR